MFLPGYRLLLFTGVSVPLRQYLIPYLLPWSRWLHTMSTTCPIEGSAWPSQLLFPGPSTVQCRLRTDFWGILPTVDFRTVRTYFKTNIIRGNSCDIPRKGSRYIGFASLGDCQPPCALLQSVIFPMKNMSRRYPTTKNIYTHILRIIYLVAAILTLKPLLLL